MTQFWGRPLKLFGAKFKSIQSESIDIGQQRIGHTHECKMADNVFECVEEGAVICIHFFLFV